MTYRRINGFETDITMIAAEGITVTSATSSSAFRHRNGSGFGGDKSVRMAQGQSIRIPAASVADAEEVAFAVYSDGAGGNWNVTFAAVSSDNVTITRTSDQYLRIYRGATLLASSLSTLASGAWYWISCEVTCKEAASGGRVRVKVNGVDFVDTGAGVDCRASSIDHFDSVLLWVEAPSGIPVYWDDYHQASAGTLPTAALFVLPITATSDASISSTSSGGGAGTYANVDEDPVSTSDYNEWTATGLDRYGGSNLPASPGQVAAVRVVAYMTGEGTITTARTLVHHAGSTGNGSYQALSTGGTYAVIHDIHELCPSTGVAWTGAQVDAMEFGVQVA